MLELESLGVRVVSGRLGRKAGEDDEHEPVLEKKPASGEFSSLQFVLRCIHTCQSPLPHHIPLCAAPIPTTSGGGSSQQPAAGVMNMGWSSSTAELDSLMQRRSSSLGLSMMSDRDLNRRGSLGSLGPVLGLVDSHETSMPPHRPLVGGGSAAAYEAARADHYAQKREEQQRRASGLGLSMGGGSGMQMGLSVNPNQ